MAEYTTNLNLIKPAKSEQYDVTNFNNNMDKIDNFAGLIPARALTADKLTTGANINGVLFDGSSDIELPFANSSLDNLTPEGKAKFDGQWVKGGGYIFQNRTLSTSTSPVQFTISFLPDNDIYELLLYSYITNISNSTYNGIITINTDIISGAVVAHIWQNTQGALGCSTIVPVSNKRLYLVGASFNSNARGSLYCIGYRKVGASFDTDESST